MFRVRCSPALMCCSRNEQHQQNHNSGSISNIDGGEYHCNKTQVRKVISGVVGAASSVTSIQVANLLRLFRIPQVSIHCSFSLYFCRQRGEKKDVKTQNIIVFVAFLCCFYFHINFTILMWRKNEGKNIENCRCCRRRR